MPQRDVTYYQRRPTVRRQEQRRRRSLIVAIVVLFTVLIGGSVGFGAVVVGVSENGWANDGGFFDLSASEGTFEPPPEPEPVPDTTTITLSFIGDCTLGTEENFNQSVSFNAYYNNYGPDYFFKNTAHIFQTDDLTVANCEGVLTTATTREDKQYAYKGPPEYANVFSLSGVDAASIANNHNYDYGWNSYSDTINSLENAGVSAFGDNLVAYREVKGIKIALIGINAVEREYSMQNQTTQRIYEAQAEGAQIIAVYMHWGEMDVYAPNQGQRDLARIAIDAGATIVVGCHPHVVQGYEMYNGRYIVYSMGNFCYGGSRGLFDPDCYIFQQTFSFSEDGAFIDDANINVIPCSISSNSDYNDYQPAIAEGSEKTRIEAKIAKLNEKLASG